MSFHTCRELPLLGLVLVTVVFASPVVAEGYDGRFGETAARYADTMLEVGRDVYGDGTMASGDTMKSGLFLSAMDREAEGGPVPLTELPYADTSRDRFGVRQGDRVFDRFADPADQRLVGANVFHDQQLYTLLYRLGETTGQDRYTDAADAALRWFLGNTRSGLNGDVQRATHLLAWGEHMSWDPFNDKAISAIGYRPPTHEFFEDWALWDRVHALDAAGGDAFAVGLWEEQVVDHDDATFSRHAPYDGQFSEPTDKLLDFPRHAGYFIETWAHALADASITDSDAALTTAIDRMLKRHEDKRAAAAAESGLSPGLVPFTMHTRNRGGIPEDKYANLPSNTELSIGAHDAAELLEGKADPALVERLYDFGTTEDKAFFLFDHDPAGAGLVKGVDTRNRGVRERNNTVWGQAYGGSPMAGAANLLIDRYTQLAGGSAEQRGTADRYRSLILEIADVYLTADPDGSNGEAADGNYFDEAVWPGEIAYVIRLELFAFDRTNEQRYLDRAIHFGDLGRDVFFGDYALPRAAGNAGHYESITGGDDLALALFELDRRLATTPEPASLSMPVRTRSEPLLNP